MKSDIRPSWFKMGVRKLETLLRDQGYSPQMIDSILSRVQYEKSKARAEKIKGTISHRLWDEVLEPARLEVASVRSILTQTKTAQRKNPADESLQVKIDVLTRYANTIAATVEKLRKVQKAADLTPVQFSNELKKAGKMPTHVDGTHWVDYVRAADRQAIEVAFGRFGPAKRGRTKTPFERRITTEAHFKAKAAMVKRINTELEAVEQMLVVEKNSFEIDNLNKRFNDLHLAQFNLDNLPRNAPIPTSWHGLLK